MSVGKCCGEPATCRRNCVHALDSHFRPLPVQYRADEPVRNPKEAFGRTKLPLHLWPATASAHGCLALLDGLLRYGRLNWRGSEIKASTYVGAALRHVQEYLEGSDRDGRSGLHPLAHALACIAIILDAEAAGKLVDDRNYPGGYPALVDKLAPDVARLFELHADAPEPKHWTRELLD